MDYVIQKDDTSISKLAVKFGAKSSQWPEFCKANPKLVTHPTYGCVYYVGNHVNIPDNWPLAAAAGPGVPAPGPNAPSGPAPVGPAVGPAPAPIAPAPVAAGMFGFDTKTILIGAGVVGLGVVAVYFLKKKSQAAAA